MATFNGSIVNDFQLRMTIDGSGGSRTVKVYAVMHQGFDWTSTLSFGGSWSGSKSVSVYAPWGGGVTQLLHSWSTTYTTSGTRTFTAQIPIVWPGGTATVTGSTSVTVGSKPPAPKNIRISKRSSDTSATVVWNGSSYANRYDVYGAKMPSTTLVKWNENTTGSYTANYSLDSEYHVYVYAVNAAGMSDGTALRVYTKPARPGKTTLSSSPDGVRINFNSEARHKNGVEVERDDGQTWLVGTGRETSATSMVDPDATVVSKYRCRSFSGGTEENQRVFSDWSDWSDTVSGLIWRQPNISSFTVERCDGVGNLDMAGEYALISSDGFTTSVPDGGAETNFMSLYWRMRKVGFDWPVSWEPIVVGVLPGPWDQLLVVGDGLLSIADAYEFQFRAADTYLPGGAVQSVVVPRATVTMAYSPTGVAVGKTWDDGVIESGLQVSGDIDVEGGLFGSTGSFTGDVSMVRASESDPRLRAGTVVRNISNGTAEYDINIGVSASRVVAAWACNGDWDTQPTMVVNGARPGRDNYLRIRATGGVAQVARFYWIVVVT